MEFTRRRTAIRICGPNGPVMQFAIVAGWLGYGRSQASIPPREGGG
jgi:hypothetical protein